MRFFRSTLLAIVLATPACMDIDKGPEDNVPSSGKADSFATPTDHGALSFGVPNHAELTDTEAFHSWTFTLTDAASVDIATDMLAANLDTVMYLYRRADPTASWGDAIERNDDADDNTSASRIKLDLAAGEYRVLVKGYKTTQRGAFAVTAACTGAGCPTTLACEPAAALPAVTGYGGTCGNRLASIYEYAIVNASVTQTVALQDRCDAPALERKAVDYYASYFASTSGALEPNTTLTIETRALGGGGSNGGSLIHVTDGGADTGMTFLFDTSGELAFSYLHSQTPEVKFFCKEATAQAVSVPNQEACVAALVAVPHTVDLESNAGLTSSVSGLPAGTGPEIVGPMKLYATNQALGNFTTLTVDGASWDVGAEKASRLTLLAANKPKVAYLATSSLVLIESIPGGVGGLVCQ